MLSTCKPGRECSDECCSCRHHSKPLRLLLLQLPPPQQPLRLLAHSPTPQLVRSSMLLAGPSGPSGLSTSPPLSFRLSACCFAVARPCKRHLSSHYQPLQHVACLLAFPGLSNPTDTCKPIACLVLALARGVEHQGHHFRCPIQDQNGLRCTYCHYDALEMGRHLKDGHTGRCVSNKWKYTFCYFGIVTEVGLVLACSPALARGV